MDVTARAVALKATDYKENDKMILLYSLEYGKISVLAKGIRKGGAKLKFACDQFCFGQYELAQSGDRFTLKTCQQEESFYCLREDIVRYYASCTVAECLINYTEDGASEPKIFVALLKALEELADEIEPLLVTLKFVLDFLDLSGLKADFSQCAVCGNKHGKLYLDMEQGGLVCDKCRSSNYSAVGLAVVATCKMLDGLPYDKLKNLNIPNDTLKDALLLLNKYISLRFTPLKCLTELVKLA